MLWTGQCLWNGYNIYEHLILSLGGILGSICTFSQNWQCLGLSWTY